MNDSGRGITFSKGIIAFEAVMSKHELPVSLWMAAESPDGKFPHRIVFDHLIV